MPTRKPAKVVTPNKLGNNANSFRIILASAYTRNVMQRFTNEILSEAIDDLHKGMNKAVEDYVNRKLTELPDQQ
jgi:hypothetical protein